VLSRRVDIGVLGVFGDISEVDAGLLRLGGAAMPGKHVPNRTGHPDLAVKLLIVTTAKGHPVLVCYQRTVPVTVWHS